MSFCLWQTQHQAYHDLAAAMRSNISWFHRAIQQHWTSLPCTLTSCPTPSCADYNHNITLLLPKPTLLSHAVLLDICIQAMKTGTIPFELWSGGKDFWQHILSSPRHAKTFDHAMVQINQLGGPAVAAQYAFDKFELIVDVAGGVGGFLCDVLKRHKGPKGIVFDQPAQIERAQKVGRLLGISHVEPMLAVADP